jgi:hypothetical protein
MEKEEMLEEGNFIGMEGMGRVGKHNYNN